MNSQMIHPIYLPFSEEQLRGHFAPTARHAADERAPRQLRYYLASAKRYRRFQADHLDRRGLPLSELRRPCQIEKDERFWVVTCLINYFYTTDRTERLGELMNKCFGDVPPLTDVASWDECFAGRIHLFFEVNLPSPPIYKRWLGENLSRRQIVPYVLDAAHRRAQMIFGKGLKVQLKLTRYC